MNKYIIKVLLRLLIIICYPLMFIELVLRAILFPIEYILTGDTVWNISYAYNKAPFFLQIINYIDDYLDKLN